jgi:peptide/nickel transport system permease protein
VAVPTIRDNWSLGAVVALVLCALAAPLLYPGDPLDTVAPALIAPGLRFDLPLGTDSIGRDVAAQLLHGARVSLVVGIVATALGMTLGTVIGGLAGYLGGWADRVLMRATELFQTFPTFLLVLAFVGIGGTATGTVILAISLVNWTGPARMVRAQVLALRGSDFVLAASGLGFGPLAILFGEILPNCTATLVAIASVMVAGAILTESGLSFLGLGDPNLASWGDMIGNGRDFLRSSPYLTIEPALAIAVTVAAFNSAGHRLDRRLGGGARA